MLKQVLSISDEARNDFSKLDKETLQNSMALFMPFKNDLYDLDSESKRKLEALSQERFVGKYKNDNEGFIKAMMEIGETAEYNTDVKLTSKPRFGQLSA